MFHEKRIWHVGKTFESAAELAALMRNANSWVLCTGFRIGDLYLLNDSTSEDAPMEFGVIRAESEAPFVRGMILVSGLQIESLTVSWISVDRLTGYIESFLAGIGGMSRLYPVTVRIDSQDGHRCDLCM